MGNTTPNNHDDFDEDLDEDFIDDFGSNANNEAKNKDSFSSSILPTRPAQSSESVKRFINLAIIGSVALAVIYFGYSYYKKSRTNKDLQIQSAPAKPQQQPDGRQKNSLEELTKPAIEAPTGFAANSKIQDLQFELTPKETNANLSEHPNTTTKTNYTINEQALLAQDSIPAKNHDLDQALAPDTFKVLKPVEDLFENETIADKAVTKATATTQAVTNNSKNNDYLKDTLASMAEEITLNVNHIQQLEATITQVNKTLDQVTQALTKLDNKLSEVSNALVIMDQDVNNIKKVISNQDLDLANLPNKISQQKNSRDPLVYSTPDYVVHAIIPGRAWLKSTGGQIVTITEGDALGDYGKVASIDATNNIVRTSSGITFR